MPEHLTERQKEMLGFIRRYFEKEGIAPTIREAALHFNFASPLSAQLHINALIKKGYLTREPLKTRGIRIAGYDASTGRSLPLAGKVRAGKPLLAFENIETHITVDRTLFRSRDAFALRVAGDSMIDAGIFEGDIVIVRPERSPANGAIVVARIEDEITIKRFYQKDRTVRLVPENRAMEPMIFTHGSVQIIGQVIGVIRKY